MNILDSLIKKKKTTGLHLCVFGKAETQSKAVLSIQLHPGETLPAPTYTA